MSLESAWIPQMDAADKHAIDEIGNCYESVLKAFYEDTRVSTRAPNDSPKATEERILAEQTGPGGSWDGSEAGFALTLAALSLTVAQQQVAGILALLRSYQIYLALAPLARAILENAARISWLLDPALHSRGLSRQRAARVFLARLDDYERAKNAAHSISDPAAPQLGADVKRIKTVELAARFYKHEIQRSKGGKLRLCGQSLPGFKESMGQYERSTSGIVKASALYDFLSNASHPTPHALTQMLRECPETGKIQIYFKDARYPLNISDPALRTFLHSWSTVYAYEGRPTDLIRAQEMHVRDVLGE